MKKIFLQKFLEGIAHLPIISRQIWHNRLIVDFKVLQTARLPASSLHSHIYWRLVPKRIFQNGRLKPLTQQSLRIAIHCDDSHRTKVFPFHYSLLLNRQDVWIKIYMHEGHGPRDALTMSSYLIESHSNMIIEMASANLALRQLVILESWMGSSRRCVRVILVPPSSHLQREGRTGSNSQIFPCIQACQNIDMRHSGKGHVQISHVKLLA